MRFGEGLVEQIEYEDEGGTRHSLPLNAQLTALARAMHTPVGQLISDVRSDLYAFYHEAPSDDKLARAVTTAIAEIASLAFEQSGKFNSLRYRPYIGVLSRDFNRTGDPGDAIKGIDWWNSADVETRRYWLERAGSTRPEDAWEAYKQAQAA